jgi:hypothetical protein
MRGVVLSVLDVVALGDKPERDGLVVDDDELMMTLRAGHGRNDRQVRSFVSVRELNQGIGLE